MHRWILSTGVAVAIFNAGTLRAAEIVDVTCEADSSQSYALYVPSTYTPDREWKLILAFDAGARGRTGVERFEAAAEKYGYIVAGSYNSRNGSWNISRDAARAMADDVSNRYRINPKRVYTAGQSGGARVAMQIALGAGGLIAGVFASSAGFPDSGDNQKILTFPVFGTAGTEDFNYVEMRKLDNQLTSPHRVEIFSGGHTWLPSELAVQAVEWMELQAMKKDPSQRDNALLKRLFEARVAALALENGDFETWQALTKLVADFQGLENIQPYSERADALLNRNVRNARKTLRDEVENENEIEGQLYNLVEKYRASPSSGIGEIRKQIQKYGRKAKDPEDSPQRQLARRIVASFVSVARGINTPEFRTFLDEIRLPRPQ